ncbi:MAG TPA: hypothetical protein VNY05_07880 [Candidatus Acidoferrales bacterium]|jgi:hypothetical protein|nr:hypothetical protein [Candidatus Acidoferrales bacterium]
MPTKFCILFAAVGTTIGVLGAQQVAAPTPEQVGPARGENTGDYNITQSFEIGYRWSLVGGDLGEYRSDVNYRNGLRLLGSSFTINSKDGHGHYFDSIVLNTMGLGNDPYQSASLRIEKNNLYRYDMLWRLNDYYNPGLTVAGGLHLMDNIRRMQDHDFTLLPQSHVRFRVGYSRDTQTGPALSTAIEFDNNGSGVPVFSDVRRQWNEYRLGADADFAGFKFTVLRRWDFFKDDTPSSSLGTVAGGTLNPLGALSAVSAADGTALQAFQRSEPVHGRAPGWLGNLFTNRKGWALNARINYTSGRNDFAMNESSAGISRLGSAASRQIAVLGNAERPMLAGDLNISLFPTKNLTVVNNTSVSSLRIIGPSSYSEFNTGTDLGTSVFFRYLSDRLVTNSTTANYRVTDWIGFFAGYAYTDRLVRTLEDFSIPSFSVSGTSLYQTANHLNTGRLGIRIKPVKPLTITVNGEVGRANNPLTPISDRNYHTLGGRVDYRAKKLQLATSYGQVYNVGAPSSVTTSSSHSRNYTASASLAPNNWFALDASYMKLHLDTVTGLQFFAGGTRSVLQNTYSSFYISNIHAVNVGARFAIAKRADVYVGYTITKDTGDGRATAVPTGVSDPIQAQLSSVQTFPLTYQSPLLRVSYRISSKVRWNAAWQFYSYGEQFHLFGPAGFRPGAAYNQNFDAHTGYTSILWAF